MRYLEIKIEIAPEGIEALLNELAIVGITDAVIDNPREIAEMIGALGDTEWYDAEQVVGAIDNDNGCDDAEQNCDKERRDGKLATITLYCTDDEDGRTRAEAIRKTVNKNSRQTAVNYTRTTGTVPLLRHLVRVEETWRDDSEWKDAWKEFYHTARVSDRFVVKPTWEKVPDDLEEVPIAAGLSGFLADHEATKEATKRDRKTEGVSKANRDERTGDKEQTASEDELLVIEIDPGMAFGTGTHETTSLSLRLMEKYVKPGDKVLDVGTGSGILAIAAAKIGAADVLGIDIDEDAVRVANENIQHNVLGKSGSRSEEGSATACSTNIRAIVGDLTSGINYKADVVVANLLADLVIRLTSSVAAHMNEDAVYITSGILIDKQPQVSRCLEENEFCIIEILEDGEWCAIAAKRSLK